jgi:uncharacterized membrane protein
VFVCVVIVGYSCLLFVRVPLPCSYMFLTRALPAFPSQALVEILLLCGGTPYANFKDLSHAWGREKGFHHLLATSVCERRGEVERKKRSDAGRQMTPEQRQVFRDKLKRARTSKDGDELKAASDGFDEDDDDDEVPPPVDASVSV